MAMGLLDDRKILITGVLSNRSIAYGVAKACRREGATLAFTYASGELKDRVVRLAADFGPTPVLACDVASDEQIASLFDALGREWGGLDGLLHSIAFAPREALSGDFLEGFPVRHSRPHTTYRATASRHSPGPRGRSSPGATPRC